MKVAAMTSNRAGSLSATAFLLMALLPVALLPGAATAQAGIGLERGAVAPDVTLQDLDGNAVRLADVIEGRPALIEFWATWCPLCEELQPQLDRLQAEHGDEIAIVAVAVAVNQNPRRIRRHLERHDPGYPYLYDVDGDAVRAFNAATTSVVVIVDADGRVAYSGVGGNQELIAEMAKLLGPGE